MNWVKYNDRVYVSYGNEWKDRLTGVIVSKERARQLDCAYYESLREKQLKIEDKRKEKSRDSSLFVNKPTFEEGDIVRNRKDPAYYVGRVCNTCYQDNVKIDFPFIGHIMLNVIIADMETITRGISEDEWRKKPRKCPYCDKMNVIVENHTCDLKDEDYCSKKDALQKRLIQWWHFHQ